jgi:protein involved in polysaccharide export with SLBB domain
MGGGNKVGVVTILAEFSLPQTEIAKLVVRQAGDRESPREGNMASLPAYRVEAPDILRIEMPKMVPAPPYALDTYDVLRIGVVGTLPNQAFEGYFVVEAEGIVTLGPAFGRVRVAGMTVEAARAAITAKLKQVLKEPKVSVQLATTARNSPVTGDYLVGPDGTINLRHYGVLRVAGKTVPEIRTALNKHLSRYFESPNASVEVRQFNSKVFYVIALTEGIDRDNIHRVPITGNETALDALSAVGGISQVSSTKIWIARPAADGFGREQILSVDYEAITRRASSATNYQIMPGDRVFVVTKRNAQAAPAARADVSAESTPAGGRRTADIDDEAAKPQSDAATLNIIRPLDVLKIDAIGTLPDQPIRGLYLVEPNGQVALGAAYGRTDVGGLTWEQAESKITQHLKTVLENPTVQVTLARRGGPWREAVLPKMPYKIGVFDVLQVRVLGTLPDQPIDGYFLVESPGTLALGPAYGRVQVKGLTTDAAEKAIETTLKETLQKPEVFVAWARSADQKEQWQEVAPPKASFTISPGTLLSIHASGTLVNQPINGTYTVEGGGTVALGPAYGRAQVKGLALEAAETAIQKKLQEVLSKPDVQVTFAGWKNDDDTPSRRKNDTLPK